MFIASCYRIAKRSLKKLALACLFTPMEKKHKSDYNPIEIRSTVKHNTEYWMPTYDDMASFFN